jgi:hypothetical protein
MKAKVVKKQVALGDNEGLAEMFNQMIGNGNIAITYPKYSKIKQNCQQIMKVVSTIANSPIMKIPVLEKYKVDFDRFVDHCETSLDLYFNIEYPSIIGLSEDEQKRFNDKYIAMRKTTIISDMIMMCDKLIPYKKHFEYSDKLSHSFILKMPGVEWKPFPFSSLNIKYIFSLPETKENTIRFFMIVFHKIYSITHQIWKDLNSPDIDINQFVDTIMNSLDEIQKRPELHRCQKAFKKIKDSVHLLKDNFDGYYKDFLSTNDSTIIMQDFIVDVSKSTNADPQLTAQFRTIIAYYRKMASSQITNPKMKMLFDKVSESFKELEKNTENMVNIKTEDDASSDDCDTIVFSNMTSMNKVSMNDQSEVIPSLIPLNMNDIISPTKNDSSLRTMNL